MSAAQDEGQCLLNIVVTRRGTHVVMLNCSMDFETAPLALLPCICPSGGRVPHVVHSCMIVESPSSYVGCLQHLSPLKHSCDHTRTLSVTGIAPAEL